MTYIQDRPGQTGILTPDRVGDLRYTRPALAWSDLLKVFMMVLGVM
jgi:hypothetical protein